MHSTRERVPVPRDRENDYTHEAAATRRSFEAVTGASLEHVGSHSFDPAILTGRNAVCCAEFRALLEAPLRPGMPALAVHSRTNAIVDWRACLDPHAQSVEIDGSHCGMAVNPHVYRELERLLDRSEETPCSR